MVAYTVNEGQYKNSLEKKQNEVNSLKLSINQIQSKKDK